MKKKDFTIWHLEKIDKCDLCSKKATHHLFAIKNIVFITKTISYNFCEEHRLKFNRNELDI